MQARIVAGWMILALAHGFGAAGAIAAEAVDCRDQQTTAVQNHCAERDLVAADAALNAAYQAELAHIRMHEAPPPYDRQAYEAAFRAAQRAWIAFRDADCKGVVPFSWGNGTGSAAAVLGCLVTRTQARTKELIEAAESR
jgi:uncharacterized protein YecT (DUF1311 family)